MYKNPDMDSRGCLSRTVAVMSIIILVGLLWCASLKKTPQEVFGSAVHQATPFIKKFKFDSQGRPPIRSMNEELTVIPKSSKGSGYGGRYALAEGYWEELTMATWNFMGLVKVASSWGARAVIPFTHNSYLHGISGRYPFDLIYDMDDVKRVCDNYSLLMPVRFDHFLSVGSRDVVFMYTDYYMKESRTNVEKCSHSQRSLMTPVLQHLNKVTAEKKLQLFREVDCCVVYSQHPTTSHEIAEACNLVGRENFTVLIKIWRGISNDYKMTYRLIADVREDVMGTISADFKHSKWVIGNATRFFHDVTDTDKCIAVHVRAEVFVRGRKVDKCFNLLREVVAQFRSNHTDLKTLLYFGDEELDMFRAKINNALVTRFKSTKYGAVPDRGFAAQVEQHTVSFCKALVISGGGSFQARTLRRFQEYSDHLPYVSACAHISGILG